MAMKPRTYPDDASSPFRQAGRRPIPRIMAEAATIPNTTPKQLGRQLRAVRRRKGLSLSEVARGAGLSRRELVAYERGKVPIPESDLWVLAGSCGVDVGELAPEHGTLELEAGPESIGDTIEFLRRGQQNGIGGGRAVLALEAADEPTPFYSGPQAAPAPPPPLSAAAPVAAEPTTAPPVDVFEELARLPEPVPLNNDPHDYPDMLAPPAYLTADSPVGSVMAESALVESVRGWANRRRSNRRPMSPRLGESAMDQSVLIDSAGASRRRDGTPCRNRRARRRRAVRDADRGFGRRSAGSGIRGLRTHPRWSTPHPTRSSASGRPPTRPRSTSRTAARRSRRRHGPPTGSPTRRRRGRRPTGRPRPRASGTSLIPHPARRSGRVIPTAPTWHRRGSRRTCSIAGPPTMDSTRDRTPMVG